MKLSSTLLFVFTDVAIYLNWQKNTSPYFLCTTNWFLHQILGVRDRSYCLSAGSSPYLLSFYRDRTTAPWCFWRNFNARGRIPSKLPGSL